MRIVVDLASGTVTNDTSFSPPAPATDVRASQARWHRNELIASVAWRVSRSNDEAELGLTPSEDRTALLQYVQALRDVPEQPGFASDITWPMDPAGA